jgi:hypothetical protein
MPPTVPTLHYGGSGFAHLSEGYEAACNALRATLEALTATAPNGRDYYPAGDDAFRTAKAEHDARVRKVRDVLHELCLLHEALVDANDARKRGR